jgi:hypothetical protein
MSKYKVVVNGCFGGFGVSAQGAEWLLANGADPEKVSVGQSEYGSFPWTHVRVDLARHDPLLVRMVEELGGAGNGDYADLYVYGLEQPLYRIHEYDGSESVEEPGQAVWENASEVGS